MAKYESLAVNELVSPTGQRITFGTAAPTSQFNKVGDIVINTAPSAAGVFCWVCSASGSPGTWITTVLGASTTATPTVPSATVAGTGTTQGTAAAVVAGFTSVTLADGIVGVLLPTASAGTQVTLKNNAAGALLVYPFTGDGINAVAVNSPYSMAGFTTATFIAYDVTTWYTVPLVAS